MTCPFFLERPLIVFDLETTGLDIAKDRIVSIAFQIFYPSEPASKFYYVVNPGMPIPKEASDIHGITNEMVAGHSAFKKYALDIFNMFIGCDIAGFNHINCDVPLLWEEFKRCGLTWDLTGVHLLDAKNIFVKKEPRTLIAGMKFYCNENHEEVAHGALADVEATSKVLFAQLERYDDLKAMKLVDVAKFSTMDNRIDLAGKFVRNDAGVALFNFGKVKGKPVSSDAGFLQWILRGDFTSNTLMWAEKFLKGTAI